MAIKLEDFIPKGTNIFGARTPTYLEGLITPEQMKQAQQQSLFQGLLGTAVGYLAQPKNQNYGSAVPYLAKSYLQGMQSAQSPFQNLERDILMKEKFADIQREKQSRDLLKSLYTTKTETIPESQYNIAPYQKATIDNYNVGSTLMGAPEYKQQTTPVAPSFDLASITSPAQTVTTSGVNEESLRKLQYTDPQMYNVIMQNQKIESEINLNKAKSIAEGIPKSRKMDAAEISAEQLPTKNPDGTNAVWYKVDGKPVNVSKTSGQTIAINMADKTINEDVGKVFITSQNQGGLASKQLADIRRMENLLSKAGQGSMQGAITDAKALFERLGVPFTDIDTEKLGAEQAARALSNQLAIALRPPASGVMTDKDFEVFLESVPSIQNTKEANRLMIAYAKDAAQRQQDLARKLREYKRATVDAYGNPKESGAVDDGIYEVVDKFWQDVALDREKKFKIQSGEIYGEPTISGGQR